MESVKLLDEILSDYPRVWQFYKRNDGERVRTSRHAQRYPLPIATISMVLEFHSWTHETTQLVSDVVGLVMPAPVRKTETGPCPSVMSKIKWLNNSWSDLESQQKHLAGDLHHEILGWHTRIRAKVNDADVYAYDPGKVCDVCGHASIVRMGNKLICIANDCRNKMTGEYRSWEIN